MIEHVRAVEDLEAILAVQGLDAVLIGPYDLAASMGLTAQFTELRFIEVLQRIRALTDSRRVPCGIHVVEPDPATLNRRLEEGYRFIAYSLDAVFLNSHASRPVRAPAAAGK